MKTMRKLGTCGLLFWLPINNRGLNKAQMVFLQCGHYIHHYESGRISEKIKEFVR